MVFILFQHLWKPHTNNNKKKLLFSESFAQKYRFQIQLSLCSLNIFISHLCRCKRFICYAASIVSEKKVASKWKSMKIIFYVLIPQRLFIFVINNRDSFIPVQCFFFYSLHCLPIFVLNTFFEGFYLHVNTLHCNTVSFGSKYLIEHPKSKQK